MASATREMAIATSRRDDQSVSWAWERGYSSIVPEETRQVRAEGDSNLI